MGKKRFPLNVGRVGVILCSKPLRRTSLKAFFSCFSLPLSWPLPPGVSDGSITANLCWPQILDFKPRSFLSFPSGWEGVRMNTTVLALHSSFLTHR